MIDDCVSDPCAVPTGMVTVISPWAAGVTLNPISVTVRSLRKRGGLATAPVVVTASVELG